MQVLYRSAIFIALSLAPGIVFAGDRLPSQELIEKSELYEQLKSMTASMQSALETLRQQGMAIDDKFEKAWSDAASSAYDAKKLFTPIQQGLKKLLTQDDQKRLLAFYNSPVGERIRKLSVKSLQPGMDTKSEAYARQILADPSKHANRLALYQKIDEAIGGTTFGTELAMNVGVATAIGMESALEGPKDVDTRAIRAAMERDRFAIAQGMASALLAPDQFR
jgi:hypothetical protein